MEPNKPQHMSPAEFLTRAGDSLGSLMRGALVFGFSCLVLYTVVTPCAQVYQWLKFGAWARLPALYLFEPPPVPNNRAEFESLVEAQFKEHSSKGREIKKSEIESEVRALVGVMQVVPTLTSSPENWLSKPHGWIGLNKLVRGVLTACPVWLFNFLMCCLLGYIALQIVEYRPEPEEKGS